MQERVYKTPVCNTNELKQRLIDTWTSIVQSDGRKSLTSGEHGCVHAGRQEVVTLNIRYNQRFFWEPPDCTT